MAKRKTALVLSAGGMFGAYQAGVWAELSRVFTPDIVVGASVGSLNGWMIASCCDPGELTSRWLNLGEAGRIRWRRPAGWTDGCLDGEMLEGWVREMCSRWQPRGEYGVVLTQLPGLKPSLFRAPEAGWQHVLASCSVPVFLKQCRIGARLYSDGGLLDPLPLWAALEMGAERVVTVNVMKHRPWVIRQAVRGLCMVSGYRRESCARVEVVEISPDSRLGSARETMFWSRANAERWIEAGRRDAHLHTAGM
jgi:NTE family protein